MEKHIAMTGVPCVFIYLKTSLHLTKNNWSKHILHVLGYDAIKKSYKIEACN